MNEIVVLVIFIFAVLAGVIVFWINHHYTTANVKTFPPDYIVTEYNDTIG